MTESEIAAIEERAARLRDNATWLSNEFPVTGLEMLQSAADVRRLAADWRQQRAENERLIEVLNDIVGSDSWRKSYGFAPYAAVDVPEAGTLLVWRADGKITVGNASQPHQTMLGVSIKPIRAGEQLIQGEHYAVEESRPLDSP